MSQLSEFQQIDVNAAPAVFIQPGIDGGEFSAGYLFPDGGYGYPASVVEFLNGDKGTVYMNCEGHLISSDSSVSLTDSYGSSWYVRASGTNPSRTIVPCQGNLMPIVERIRAIRMAEGYSQPDFCRETGLKLDTLRAYEQGKRKGISSGELEKITSHPQLEKYALWLVTGKTAPAAGQISPEIEQARQSETG